MSLYKKSDATTRFNIVTELIGINDQRVCPFLVKVLNDKSALVRHEAAFGLGQIGNITHCDILRKVLINDNNELVRHESACALGYLADSKSARYDINKIAVRKNIHALKRILKDKSEIVSESARFAINKISSK